VLDADPAALERLGRHVFVGFRDLDEVRALIARRATAGVFITAANVQGLSVAEVRQQVSAMQDIRLQQGLPPLWIATDQEGGQISRLSPPLPRPPRTSQLLAPHRDAA